MNLLILMLTSSDKFASSDEIWDSSAPIKEFETHKLLRA